MTLSKQVWYRLKRLKKSDFGLEEKVATRSRQKPLSVWNSLDEEEVMKFKEKKRRELDALFGTKYADIQKELEAVNEEIKALKTTIKAIRTLVENIENAESEWWKTNE